MNRPEFGWQFFGGNLKADGGWIQPLDAGTFDGIEINTRTNSFGWGFLRRHRQRRAPADQAKIKFVSERGAFTIPLQAKTTWIELR